MPCTGHDRKAPAGQWQPAGQIFEQPGADVQRLLEQFPQILESVWPLKRARRESLPHDIAELSRILTAKRSRLDQPYWSRPAFISAYLYYFLPWNIIRLSSLLTNLSITAPAQVEDKFPVLYDAGSGPLTFILALWAAKPQWRALPLHCLALDKSPQPLELGLKLYEAIASVARCKPWIVKTARAGIFSLPRFKMAGGYAWLISAINIFNEQVSKKIPKDAEDGAEARETDILESWQLLWDNPQAKLLLVEPGTRLGGTTVMKWREQALEAGLMPVEPCVHSHACPLQKSRNPNSSYGDSWCHFTFSALNAPVWLKTLSAKAGLHKTGLTLSYVLLGETPPKKNRETDFPARVVSRSFPTSRTKFARYGCAEPGLVLLENAKDVVSGSLVKGCVGKYPQKDEKSGAIILECAATKKPAKRRS